MVKLIMAMGYPRNVASEVAFYIEIQGLQYKDFRNILEEIRENSAVIRSRYKSMAEAMDRYNELAKRIVPTAANPYPFASLNFPIDFDLCNQYRLTRVLELHYRRKARIAVKRLSATMRKAASSAAVAADAFGNLATAMYGSEVGFMGGSSEPPYEGFTQADYIRIKRDFPDKPNPWMLQREAPG